MCNQMCVCASSLNSPLVSGTTRTPCPVGDLGWMGDCTAWHGIIKIIRLFDERIAILINHVLLCFAMVGDDSFITNLFLLFFLLIIHLLVFVLLLLLFLLVVVLVVIVEVFVIV